VLAHRHRDEDLGRGRDRADLVGVLANSSSPVAASSATADLDSTAGRSRADAVEANIDAAIEVASVTSTAQITGARI